jgi:hypothetical protein
MPFAAIAQPEDDIRPLGEAACGGETASVRYRTIRPKRNDGTEIGPPDLLLYCLRLLDSVPRQARLRGLKARTLLGIWLSNGCGVPARQRL